MTKQISNHAAAAKLIRAELKKHGIKASVRASSASMTSSVNISLTEALPATVEQVEAFAGKFQYGHFDGMTDCYEYSNRDDNLPQVKHVFVQNEMTDEIRQAAWDYARETYADAAEGPADYNDAREYMCGDLWGDMFVSRILHGSEQIAGNTATFWTSRKPRVAV